MSGELDLSSSGSVEHRVKELESRGVRVLILDLRGLTFVDSTGLRLIMSAHGRARGSGRRLVLVRGPEVVQRVFKITRLERELEFVDDPTELLGVGAAG